MKAQRYAFGGVVLSLIGLGLAAYLTILHIGLLRGELLGGAACGTAGTLFNCHAVSASRWGSLFGMPLSLWGGLGYLATVSLAFVAWQFPDWTVRALGALAVISLSYVAFDVFLFIVMATQIGYLCPVCLATYAVNAALAWGSVRGTGRRLGEVLGSLPSALGAFIPRREAAVWVVWGVVLTGAAGVVSVHQAVRFMAEGAPGTLRKQMRQFVEQQSRRVTVEVSRDPVHGASHPSLQIVEFSDFLCPSCQKAARFNPIFLATHRATASFVFKQFPLDMSCNDTVKRTVHPNACQVAAATECAQEQGRFWPMHDLLFAKMKGPNYNVQDLERDAVQAGLDVDAYRACMEAGRGMEAVKADIVEAARLGVASTPTYVVDGLVIPGVLTPAAFNELADVLKETRS